MKKLVVVLSLFAALIANANTLLTEPFNYSNGAQISQQPGWGAHSSAGSGPQTVTNNHLRIIFSNQEDTDVVIPGAPYNGGNFINSLYASMTINFSQLPNGTNQVAGNYFCHFWDSSTGIGQVQGFRCRVFAYTNGVTTPGTFFLALSSTGGTFTNSDFTIFTNTALTTNIEYNLVLRLDVSGNASSGTAQMWINPDTASSTSLTVAGLGAGPVDIAHFCFRQVGSGGAGVADIGKLKIGTAFTDVAGTNTPPNVSGLPSRIDTPRNVTTAPIPFIVTDDNTNNSPTNITISVTSTNTVVVPVANVTFGGDGTGTNRTVTIKPGTSQQGSSLLTFNVVGQGGATNAVQVLVVVGAPSISTIQNQIVPVNSAPTAIPFQVSDHESTAGSLSVSGTSANTALVPNSGLSFSAAADGTNRTVTITPVSGVTGSSVITVTVRDIQGNSASTSFTYDVAPQPGVLLSENWNGYADGSAPSQLFTTPSWNKFSGTAGELVVSNGMAVINENNSEDISTTLTGAPIATNNGAVLYYGFKLITAKLPSSATGEYFMLLKDTTTSGFRAKTFVLTGQSAPGYFRLGVANTASVATAVYPQDLSVNTTYYVVVRYIVDTASTTLWVNPTSESSSSVTAPDTITPQQINELGLRESQVGEGIEYIDNIVVSSAFSDVAPALIVKPIANQATAISTSTGPIPFIVTDKSVSPDACTYVATSDNQALVPNGNISFGGSSSNRTITLNPVSGQEGFANISVVVSDSAGNTNNTGFLLTVGAPATNGIVFSQIYPGGGNSGATYSTKFVELFNRSSRPVSLNNWSLQYASSTGASWNVGNFANVIVPANKYYLVAIGPVGTNGVALPASVDYTLSGVNPSQTVGKLALCNSQGPLSSATPVGNATIVDFVGYGTGTSAYEGTGPVAWATDNTKSMFRASGGCVDANDNASDFSVAVVSPRNSATAANQCVSAAPTMRAFISGNNLVIAWPSTTVGFNLETATTVNQNPWTVVSTTPTVVGNEYQVSLPINTGAFYRMKH